MSVKEDDNLEPNTKLQKSRQNLLPAIWKRVHDSMELGEFDMLAHKYNILFMIMLGY